MRKVIGISCIVLGLVCLLSAAGFVVYNRFEAEAAEESSKFILRDVQSIISENVQEAAEPMLPEESPGEMPAVQLDGYNCVGILSIPVLELELPVLDDWDYDKLQKAPCVYYGTCYGTDFVIAAHNYDAHFGRLSQLQAGDLVLFTDTRGVDYCYEVSLLETLPATATEEMITSGFDLSLYTCTPGGQNRVTLRCTRVQN